MTPEIRKSIFMTMLRIRRVQERIEAEYLEDRMRSPVHLCVGQEAIAAAVCQALEPRDYITSNHRGHGHYLARGGDLKAMMAELHCKKTGCSGGYGGSMHLVDPDNNNFGHSAIVGGGIPIGTGLGLASAMQNLGAVSVIFFGDGAAEEGVFYESVNYAMLRKLPVVYVLENNRWAVCSCVDTRQPCENVFHSGAPRDMLLTARINGNDADLVYETARSAIDRARNGLGPALIECDTYRIMGHAGCTAQDAKGYREECEVDEWRKRCPVKAYEEILLEQGVVTRDDVVEADAVFAREIDEAFAYALDGPLPGPEDLHKNLFCE